MKNCIACGMPMEKAEDFATGDESKEYCRYCARPDGSMQNYPEKLASMSGFIVKTQGLSEEAARLAAREMLSRLPAWKGIAGRN
ncbi:MAG TPA: zinc ribbon domain-containing protein [Spirochaetia bacterium]|nr:zinc ribbon domain-containing protein [Spirochaetia bacterium]